MSDFIFVLSVLAISYFILQTVSRWCMNDYGAALYAAALTAIVCRYAL